MEGTPPTSSSQNEMGVELIIIITLWRHVENKSQRVGVDSKGMRPETEPIPLGHSVRHCGLVGSAPARDGTGCEFDSWQCRIYIPCSLSLRLLGSLRGSLGTYGLTQKLC